MIRSFHWFSDDGGNAMTQVSVTQRCTFGRWLSVFVLACLGLGFAAALVQGQEGVFSDPTDPRVLQGPKKEAVGDRAMVSTQSPMVTEAALDVLRDGGNAFDALITAVLLQQVTEPHMVSHWGIMTGVIYDAETGRYRAFDGIGARPLASRSDKGDPAKVAVGGTVKALGEIWKRYGTKPWEYYFEPAIKAAEDGVLVTSYMYGIIYAAWENTDEMWPEGVRDIIGNEEANEFYRPGGFQVPVGKRWKMPELAAHLRRLAKEGADYMYTGEWAEKFVEKSNELGGRVSLEDLAEYEVIWREPVRFEYRGYEVISEPAPNYGGAIIGTNLNILRHFDLQAMGHYSEAAKALEIMARAADRAFFEFGRLRDPENFHTPTDLLLSPTYGELSAKIIRQSTVRPGVSLAPEENEDGPDPEKKISGDGAMRMNRRSFDSNHNVIVDGHGNWISSLHSGHGGTPGYFVDGVEANGSEVPGDTMGPGRRLVSPLSATIVAKDGEPWLALGTPGFPPQPVTEVLVNILEYGMTPAEAINAPRFWQPSDNGQTVAIESRIDDSVRSDMAAAGFKIVDLAKYDWHLGSVQLIWRDSDTGQLHGVSDPRRLGYAEALNSADN